MDIKISEMKENDIAEILKIEKVSFASPWSKNNFLNELRNKSSYSFVARINLDNHEIVAGYIILWIICNEAHILNIAVHPDFRRMGIGRKLLIYAAECSSMNNVEEIYLEVRISNIHAINLYEGLGFISVGIRPNYYMDSGDNKEDAVIMLLTLKDVSITL